MKYLAIWLIFACFISCKSTQKTVSGSEVGYVTDIANDISLTDDTRISELTDQIIERLVNEQLNIGIKQTKYDTGKPLVEGTGKYPVVEEIEINIDRKSAIYQTDSVHRVTDNVSAVVFHDNSEINSDLKVETKEKKEIGLKKWQNILITIGISVVFGFLLSLFFKK